MTALTSARQNTKQLFIIDKNVDGWRDLVNNAGIGVSVLLLDPSQNGLTQIANAITAYSNLDAIHILSHGSVASLQLGSVTLNSENLNQYTQQLTTIGNALNENGDLLLYGCNVAQGETGKQFIQALAQITGADVAASDDLTGNTALGGDWVLEASTGTIEADIAVSSDTQQNYNHVLGKPSDYVFAQMSNLAYSDNPSFAGWVVQTYTYVLSLGFFAVEFLKGNDIVIAFRGTNFDSSGVWDIGADTAIANPSPDWSSQFDYAIQTANIIREASPNAHIYVTGHSLGGALAQVVSQMFGFEGATFEPGGAQNIVDSSQFSIEASAIGITPVGVPTGFINYTVDGSLISSESGAHVGNTVTLENTYVINFFLSNLTGNPLIDIRVTAREQKALHSIDGIVTLMQARAVADVASVLQPSVDSWIAGAATGDLGVSEQPIGQGALDYYGTDGNNYLYANNNDNIIYGYAGNDIIYSFAGNDTVYGGEGDDTISTAQGNDVIDTGGGNDTVYAGSGDDTISVLVNYGATNTVSGGTGIDGLNIDFSANPYTRLYWYGIDTSGSYSSQINSDSSITAIQAVLDNTVKFYVGYSPNFNQNYSSSYNLGVTFDGIENLSLIASDTGLDDLLIVQGNGNYDGKGGNDAVYADWSNATHAIKINNSDLVTVQDFNGSTVKNIERWLVKTGSGDDQISTANYNYDDAIYSGAGNDNVSTGGGSDIVDTGDGNDVITVGNNATNAGSGGNGGNGSSKIQAGSGDDTISVLVNYGATNTVSGGTGIDGLNIDFSANPYTRLYWYGIDTSGSYSSQINSDSSITAIQAVLDNTVKFYVGYSPNFNQNYSSSYNLGVTFDGIENLSLIASDTGLDDLLIVQGNGNYDGKGGTDTLYADWSKSTANIIWNNAPTQTQTVNGITVSGLERLLLMTGSGDDTLSNLNTATDDTFDSGAGNDIIQSGAGNDTLHGGSGTDVLQGGDGNDVYLFNIGDGHDQIIDTAGTDRLVFGANITASQIGVSRVGNEIRLAISADDSIRFTENAIGSYAIERIEFQNGTVWTATQIQQNINSTVNHTPALSHPLIDQIIKQQSNNPNAIFSYAIPANSFTDIDGDALTYRASLADGSALPNWLGFDANTRTFSASTAIVNAGSFDIKVTATDSLGASISDDFKLLVEANHAPTVLAGAALVAGVEDTPYILNVADFLTGFSDVDGDNLSLVSLVVSPSLPASVVNNNNGTYTISTPPNYNGNLVVYYTVEDGRGGMINSMQNLTILPVNDAPSGTDKTITLNENSSYSFTAADFGFSDADGNSLLAVKISSLPLAGSLKLNGIVITGNASISVADMNNGQFTFSPVANGSGNHYASFNFQVQDNGGTANNGLDLDGSANTLSVDVTASSSTPIIGTAGNDRLKGTVGADTLLGGAGDDTYYVDVAGDTITENTGEGADVVYSTATSYTLSANIETLIIAGAGVNGTGNAQNNYLMGSAGNNSLDGQGGADVMAGGAGDDSYTVDDKDDVIIENLGTGLDTVYSSISYSLAANIENLVLTGTAINGFGNELSNQITGNNADNILGGGAGADTMIGLAGNDTYYVDDAGDVIVEAVNGGTDIVYSTTASYTLADNIETLIVWLSAVNGTGNAQDNYIIGNTRNNTLDGRAGNDILYGDEGLDTYIGGLGADSLNLTEATAATDTVRIATGDSLATLDSYDLVTRFKLGTGVFNTTGVDKLDLATTAIAANVTAADGVDSGVIRSHSINNGIISFDDVNNYTSPLAISASTNLANVFSYLQTNITGGNTVAFVADTNNTYVFQDGGVTDTLVELLGVTATSVNNTGLIANSVWVI